MPGRTLAKSLVTASAAARPMTIPAAAIRRLAPRNRARICRGAAPSAIRSADLPPALAPRRTSPHRRGRRQRWRRRAGRAGRAGSRRCAARPAPPAGAAPWSERPKAAGSRRAAGPLREAREERPSDPGPARTCRIAFGRCSCASGTNRKGSGVSSRRRYLPSATTPTTLAPFAVPAQAAADGLASREVPPREGLVDDDGGSRTDPVRRRELATASDGDPHRSEVPSRDDVVADHQLFPGTRDVAVHRDRARSRAAEAERHAACEREPPRRPGASGRAPVEPLEEGGSALGRVAEREEVHLGEQHASAIEPGIEPARSGEASEEEAGRHQQNQGKGHLCHDERRSQAYPPPRADERACAARQIARDLGAGGLQRRDADRRGRWKPPPPRSRRRARSRRRKGRGAPAARSAE